MSDTVMIEHGDKQLYEILQITAGLDLEVTIDKHNSIHISGKDLLPFLKEYDPDTWDPPVEPKIKPL